MHEEMILCYLKEEIKSEFIHIFISCYLQHRKKPFSFLIIYQKLETNSILFARLNIFHASKVFFFDLSLKIILNFNCMQQKLIAIYTYDNIGHAFDS